MRNSNATTEQGADMIKNLWQSAIIFGALGFSVYVLSSTSDCGRVERSVVPITGATHGLAWISRHWLESTDTTGIEQAGATAARLTASAISQTFLGPGKCSFPEPATPETGGKLAVTSTPTASPPSPIPANTTPTAPSATSTAIATPVVIVPPSTTAK